MLQLMFSLFKVSNDITSLGKKKKNSCIFTYYVIIGLETTLLKDLSRRLKEAKVQDLVKSLKDMYMDFIGMFGK